MVPHNKTQLTCNEKDTTKLEDWPMSGLRRASVRNFGHDGTNRHLDCWTAGSGGWFRA